MATNKNKSSKTIILVGLMGAGKSSVGRRLAKAMHMQFSDSDDDIAVAAGCSISDIFSVHGESIFRDLERRVIARLLSEGPPRVLATGGGAWMNPSVRDLAEQYAVSVWLRADIDVLVERVSRKNTRPLLEQGDKFAILDKMAEERNPYYALADVVVDSGEGTQEQIIRCIIRRLRESHPHIFLTPCEGTSS
ncbi:MAG: shikimate kinase [Alphaproteobacteria bacterium]|nr:MAG: shikimate kinase [Alphaproteobacteria bacterium]TAF14287.1 MAG: shikimate kinase [Alphaproteobacteria bacterium]TAF76475.1 MAG: shikimate kinase [Alphaproteobacteria bacterium]